MSEVVATPAPPPPPFPPAPPSFDFGKPFSFVFDDPRWLQKILIGGLFYIAGFLIIGWFFILGYVAQTARNVIAGLDNPLPEWEDIGKFFAEGARLIGIALCYILPLMFLIMLFVIPAIISDVADSDAGEALSGGMAGCMACLIVPLAFAITFFLPASLLFAVVEQRFGAAFEFGRIWAFIRANMGNYLLAIVIYLIARFLAGFGVMLLCVGVVFTGFWSFLIMAHGFAQVWKLRRV